MTVGVDSKPKGLEISGGKGNCRLMPGSGWPALNADDYGRMKGFQLTRLVLVVFPD